MPSVAGTILIKRSCNLFDSIRFKDIILAQGNVIDRADAYRDFRGRDPDVDALLENRGFPTGK